MMVLYGIDSVFEAPPCNMAEHELTNWRQLMVGIRILSDEELCQDRVWNERANLLLMEFQRGATHVWPQFCTLSIHMLGHLAADVMKHGPVDRYSCFKYENALAALKRTVRSRKAPLASALTTLKVQPYFISRGLKYEPKVVPGLKNPMQSTGSNVNIQYSTIELAKFTLKATIKDCHFGVRDAPRKVIKFIRAERDHGEIVVYGQEFLGSEVSFELQCNPTAASQDYNSASPDRYPIDTRDVGIIRISRRSDVVIRINWERIKYKYVVLHPVSRALPQGVPVPTKRIAYRMIAMAVG
jgi:hypothetical protein